MRGVSLFARTWAPCMSSAELGSSTFREISVPISGGFGAPHYIDAEPPHRLGSWFPPSVTCVCRRLPKLTSPRECLEVEWQHRKNFACLGLEAERRRRRWIRQKCKRDVNLIPISGVGRQQSAPQGVVRPTDQNADSLYKQRMIYDFWSDWCDFEWGLQWTLNNHEPEDYWVFCVGKLLECKFGRMYSLSTYNHYWLYGHLPTKLTIDFELRESKI